MCIVHSMCGKRVAYNIFPRFAFNRNVKHILLLLAGCLCAAAVFSSLVFFFICISRALNEGALKIKIYVYYVDEYECNSKCNGKTLEIIMTFHAIFNCIMQYEYKRFVHELNWNVVRKSTTLLFRVWECMEWVGRRRQHSMHTYDMFKTAKEPLQLLTLPQKTFRQFIVSSGWFSIDCC